MVNRICDHSLLIGYAEQQRRIDQRIVRRALAYVEDKSSWRAWLPAFGGPRLRQWLTAMAAIGLVGGAALVTLSPVWTEPLQQVLSLMRSARELLVP
jgi:hypothetical protein